MASGAKIQKLDSSLEYIYQYIPEVSNEMATSNIEWFKRDLFPLIGRRLKRLDEFRILAIGSGAGVTDCVFLKELFAFLKEGDVQPKISYTVVERDERGIKTFENQTSKEVREDHKELTFDWRLTTMEEYFKTPLDKKFHIIHFIHSLCSRKSCKVVLPSVLKTHLDDQGVIFAVLGDPNDLFLGFFLKYVGFERYEHHHDDKGHDDHGEEAEKGDLGNEHRHDKSHGHHHDHHDHDHHDKSHGHHHDHHDKSLGHHHDKSHGHHHDHHEKSHGHHHDKSHGHHHDHHHHDHHHHHHGHHGEVEEFDFKKFAEEKGYECLSFINEVECDVTEIIKRSPKGMKKLEGLFDTHDVSSKLPEEELNEVIEKIKNGSKTKTVDGVEKQYLIQRNDVVMMWKEPSKEA